MKKIFVFVLLAGTFSGALFSQATQIGNDLTVFSENAERFIVTMNGQALSDSFVTSISVKDIQNDYVKLVIKFEDSKIPVLTDNYCRLVHSTPQGYKSPGSAVYQIRINKKGEYVLRSYSHSQKQIQGPAIIVVPGQTPPANRYYTPGQYTPR